MTIEISEWEKSIITDALEESIRNQAKSMTQLEDLDDIEAAAHVITTQIDILGRLNG